MKILVEHGSDVNAADEKGRTPLRYAVDRNTEWTVSVVEFFLENNYGLTALHSAAGAA